MLPIEIRKIFVICLALVMPKLCIGFTGGADNGVDSSKYPLFKPLKEGKVPLKGEVYVKNKVKELDKISFSGDLKIGASNRSYRKWIIKSVGDPSTNELDLTKISEIEVLNKKYVQENDYFLAKVVFDTGATAELLIPKKLVICGEKVKSRMGKAWFLRDINKLVIKKEIASKSKK